MMTSDELTDLRNIASAVQRIERRQETADARLDKLERFADRAEGAITLAKFTLSLLGIGGIGIIIAAVSRGAL